MDIQFEQMRKGCKLSLVLLIALVCIGSYAQELRRNDVEVKTAVSPHPGRFIVTQIKNLRAEAVTIRFTNEYHSGRSESVILKGYEKRSIDLTCNVVEAKLQSDDRYIEIIRKSKMSRNPSVNTVSMDEILTDFYSYIETIPLYSTEQIKEEGSEIDSHINALRNWKDRDAYIAQNHLVTFVSARLDSIERCRKETASFVEDYINKYGNRAIEDRNTCIDSLQSVISNRLDMRKRNLNRLSEEVSQVSANRTFDLKQWNWRLICIGAVLLVLIVILVIWFVKANKKSKKNTTVRTARSTAPAEASAAIVVRRRTTSILRKQSLEDVINNEAYLKIDCADFCTNSAVRRIYLKNTCIKAIYNMYAEDLRKSDNPKENGCMVLGRWVRDDETKEYYVSLEEVVLPGDDAVFSEYELNFGGKIKVKVTEKLRKLRRDTNLQYDLTCWVHSHPGLGVFFSSSDNNVQMQLKHLVHPNFLTAIVVDILTPQQEMGIFTFKKDGTVNAKSDLTKMFSLEELYKWAVESDRNSFKPENHYNTLADSKLRIDKCYGIELSNGAIVDMGMLAMNESLGFVGMVHGYSTQIGLRTEHVAVTVNKEQTMSDQELMGCMVFASHCSIPSVRKIIAPYLEKIKFVLVFTANDGLLTSIPVVDGDLCADQDYYGEQQLEELKIWTRRKR